MKRIDDEVRRGLGRFGPAAGMAELVAAWPAVVGEAVARNAWPARFARDGTLHVAASSSAWAFELIQLERTILDRLREKLGESAPKRLRFAPGRLPEPGAEAETAAVRERPRPSPAETERAGRMAAEISDEKLRGLVARAAAASLARASDNRAV
jgi:hypothetical protein